MDNNLLNWLCGDKEAKFPLNPKSWPKVQQVKMPKRKLFKKKVAK